MNRFMTYITTDKTRIAFPLSYSYREKELQRVFNLKHSILGMAECYTMVDKGAEYFII